MRLSERGEVACVERDSGVEGYGRHERLTNGHIRRVWKGGRVGGKEGGREGGREGRKEGKNQRIQNHRLGACRDAANGTDKDCAGRSTG
jgi:hypothetical protein